MVWSHNHPSADPKARPGLPGDLPPDMMAKRFFAKQYQWPPWVTGELSLEELEWLPILESAADDASEAISEIEQDRAEREAKYKNRRLGVREVQPGELPVQLPGCDVIGERGF